jgi:hypothetical protein
MKTVNNIDRTYVAVSRQLKVMACDQYEIGIFNRAEDKMFLRVWSAEIILKSIGYLKRMNSQDHDIFIRPFGATGLIFFDDFNRGMLARLNADGLAPALVIQSSPLNYHGWIRISEVPQSETLCTFACKVIAKKYGGDDGAAKWRQFGRLAGFTNRKPKYIDDLGKRPFVLLDEAQGVLAQGAAELLSSANELMAVAEAERAARVELYKSIVPDSSLKGGDAFYLSELNGLLGKYGAQLDYSKADWVIVNKMLKRGYHRASVEAVLLEHSQHIHGRSTASALNYVELTLNAALGIK